MPNRAKIFLSSPMPGTSEWTTIRDGISSHFNGGALGTVFALTKIETEGGDGLSDIYLDQVDCASVVLVVFKQEIRPGQKDEIDFALEHEIPLIVIRFVEPSSQLSFETEEYIKTKIFPKTRMSEVYTFSDLLTNKTSSLVGMVRRRLKHARPENNAVRFAAQSERFVTQKYETVAEFCVYCIEEHNFSSALSIAEHLNKEGKDHSSCLSSPTLPVMPI